MKRLLIGLFGLALSSLFFVNNVSADVQDFSIKNFHADYYLSKDSEGRSILKTVELITADFPVDQNHGIERALPKKYDGHLTSLAIESVNDQNGDNLNYTTYSSDGNLVLRIGDADRYVSGLNTYIITYNQRDVTKYFADTNDDEFYWDVNGVGWSQPFSQVSATVHIDPSLSDKVSGEQSCYYGDIGSNANCNILLDKEKSLVTASTSELSAGQTMTIAIGFAPHTFAAHKMSLQEASWIFLMVFCYLIILFILYLRIVKYRSAPSNKAIVAQYVPPVGVELSTSSAILGVPYKAFTAAIISMAVKRNIQITEKIINFLFGIKIKKYNLELLSASNLTTTEREIALILFGAGLPIGRESSVDFPKTDMVLTPLLTGYVESVKSQIKDVYLLPKKTKIAVMIEVLSGLLIIGAIPAAIFVWDNSNNLCFTIVMLVIIIICLSILRSLPFRGPLNKEGRELYDYLMGLKLFIKTVEQDRIKMLQTPSGAEKVTIDPNDKGAVVKLYEQLLPYAILFGLEKEWSKVLAVYYSEQSISPAWYAGVGGFSASSFSSSLSSFSSSLGSSSSSGGSGGGGSSGGGGGGGGGGGW